MIRLNRITTAVWTVALKQAGCISCCLLAVALYSCTTRSQRRIQQFSDVLETGRYRSGISSIQNKKKLYGRLNQFLYWFDQGVLYHYAGAYDSSRLCLENAESVLDKLYARSITNEAASILTNDNIRPYRARRYEQVLLHQFLSFDYLARRRYDESLVETRKVQLVFDRFEDRDKGKERYRDDGMAHFMSALVYQGQGEVDNALISLYKSVSAYKSGPVPLPEPVEDYAYRSLSRGGREHDIEELGIEAHAGGVDSMGTRGGEIILVGYAGKGPFLDESIFWGTYIIDGLIVGSFVEPDGDTVSFNMPAPPLPAEELARAEKGKKTKSGTTFHIKFALPAVVRRDSRTAGFYASVDSASRQYRSFVVTNIERLIEQDLEDNRAATLARTAARVVIRTIAAQRAKREMESSSPALNLLVNIGADVLADQLEKADTRLSIFLPRTIHVTRIPVDAGVHQVNAVAVGRDNAPLDNRSWENIEIRPGEKRFLFYPSLR